MIEKTKDQIIQTRFRNIIARITRNKKKYHISFSQLIEECELIYGLNPDPNISLYSFKHAIEKRRVAKKYYTIPNFLIILEEACDNIIKFRCVEENSKIPKLNDDIFRLCNKYKISLYSIADLAYYLYCKDVKSIHITKLKSHHSCLVCVKKNVYLTEGFFLPYIEEALGIISLAPAKYGRSCK